MSLKSFLVAGLVLFVGALSAAEFVMPLQWGALTSLRWDGSRQQGVVTGGDQYVGFRYREGLVRSLTGGPAPGASDVSLDPVTGDYFVSASVEGTLKFVSGRDFSLKTSLPAAAPKPSLTYFHPMLKKLGSFNGPGTLTLFDVETTAYEGLIPLSDLPVRIALAPDGRLLSLLPNRREVVLLAYRPFRILMRFALPEACETPMDLAVESVKARLWLACGASGVYVADYPGLEWVKDVDVPEAQSVFWDGEQNSLIVVTGKGVLLVQKTGQGVPRVLAELPPNTLVDWDHRFHRPVTATRSANAITLTVHTELTLEPTP